MPFMNLMPQLSKLLLLGIVVLTACQAQTEAPELPLGAVELTGTIAPLALTPQSKGTHYFHLDGSGSYVAKSAIVNLRKLEGKRVVVSGEAVKNIHSVPPYVLTVHSITEILNEQLVARKLDDLDITMLLPESWVQKYSPQQYSYYALTNEDEPILTVDISSEPLPNIGELLLVNNTKAVFTTLSTHEFMVRFLVESTVVQLHFTYPETSLNASEQVKVIAESIVIANKSSSSSIKEDAESTGSSSSLPTIYCGGVAGILCPTNFYCDIQDAKSNSGICRAL